MALLSALVSELLQWKTVLTCGAVMFNPLFWIGLSKLEYYTRVVSRTCGGPKQGVVALAIGIILLDCVRITLFHNAIDEYGTWDPMKDEVVFSAFGYLLIMVGTVLGFASFWRLGFFCCFLGDHFGILLDEKVTGFPFNVVADPMYWGSVLFHLGITINNASLVGLLLTTCIGLSYIIAVLFERPFTENIYAEKAAKSQ